MAHKILVAIPAHLSCVCGSVCVCVCVRVELIFWGVNWGKTIQAIGKQVHSNREKWLTAEWLVVALPPHHI